MRDTIFKERYKFFLVENHSELCNNLNKNNIKKNINISEDIKIKKEKNNLKKTKIIHLKQMKRKMKMEVKKGNLTILKLRKILLVKKINWI